MPRNPPQNITFDLASNHQTYSCSLSFQSFDHPKNAQAEDQRTLLVYTWPLGQRCVVPLLELAPMSSEEPATGIGQPVIGDMRK